MSVNFYYEDISDLHLDKRKLKNWIVSAINEEGKQEGDLSFIFCTDDYLLEINKQYLQHDYYTDIITFDYVDGQVISGDIFISSERINENAGIYKVSFNDELNRIIIHGVLHLLGFKDKDQQDKELMTQREDYFLAKL